jgi:hypothetical protein
MRKKLFSILVTAAIVGTLTACGGTSSSSQTASEQTSAASVSETSDTADAVASGSTGAASETSDAGAAKTADEPAAPTTGHWEGDLGAGNYTAGKDIPYGTYNLTAASGSGNVSSSNMYAGGLNEVMGSDTSDGYTQNTFNGLQMTDGVVLSVGGTVIIHLSSDDAQISNITGRVVEAEVQTDLSAGNYTAGTDFPAGVYNIVATGSSGNVSSSNLYDGGLNEIMGTDTSDGMTVSQVNNVELPEGTTLTVSGTSVQLVPVGK